MKTFKLLIENTKATTLELISRLAGDRIFPAYKSSTGTSTASSNGFGNPLNDAAVGTIDNKVIRVLCMKSLLMNVKIRILYVLMQILCCNSIFNSV